MNGIVKKKWEIEISSNLIAKNFEILNFYGKEIAFIWNNKQLISLNYTSLSSNNEIQMINDDIDKPTIIESPRAIKSICSYSERVFIICKPTGIFKLTDKYKFSLLSDSGIGLATEFHHVLTPKNDYLYLGNKLTKKNTPLFHLYQSDNDENSKNSVINYDLSKILINHYQDDDKKICLISNYKKLYKLTGELLRIIYHMNDSITQIHSINRNKTIGYCVLTDANYILILFVDNCDKLSESRKIYYDGIIETLTFYCNGDKLMSFHSNGNNINCKLINVNTLDVNSIVKNFNNYINCINVDSLKTYNNKIYMLSHGNKLTLFDIIDEKMNDNNDNDEFYKLTKDMIKGTHIIVDRICERAEKLEIINRNIELLKNRIQRINVYMHKQFTEYSPIIDIFKMFDCNYLRVKFLSLPINTRIIVSIKIDKQRIFSSKNVNNTVTILELPILNNSVQKLVDLDLRINLITDYCNQQIWCILNNSSGSLRNIRSEDEQETVHRINFLNAKLMTLRNLMQEENIDSVKLYNIKKSVRKGAIN